jgi:hypothetical protein
MRNLGKLLKILKRRHKPPYSGSNVSQAKNQCAAGGTISQKIATFQGPQIPHKSATYLQHIHI